MPKTAPITVNVRYRNSLRRVVLMFAAAGFAAGFATGAALGSLHRFFNDPNAYVALWFGLVVALVLVLATREGPR